MALARKIVNWEGGSDARYDITGLRRLPNGHYTDGTYEYDENGLDLSGRPHGGWTPGLPGARGGTGPGDGGGGAAPGGGGGALTSSPYYQQVLAATNAAAAADAATRRTGIQQALIQFGLVPEGFQDKYGDVDDLTRRLAGQSTGAGLSTRARLLQARSDAIRSFTNSLSARGLRRSGAKGYGLKRRQLDFDQAYQDALSKLLGYTGGLYSQFGQNEYQRQLGLANALMNLSQSFSFSGGGGGGGGGGAAAAGPAWWQAPSPTAPSTTDLFYTVGTGGASSDYFAPRGGAGGGGFVAQ